MNVSDLMIFKIKVVQVSTLILKIYNLLINGEVIKLIPDYRKLIFNMNDEPDKRVFENEDFLVLLQNIKLLKDNERLISIDDYHSYFNNDDCIYGYAWDGSIYRISRAIQKAEFIDVFNEIEKIKEDEL